MIGCNSCYVYYDSHYRYGQNEHNLVCFNHRIYLLLCSRF